MGGSGRKAVVTTSAPRVETEDTKQEPKSKWIIWLFFKVSYSLKDSPDNSRGGTVKHEGPSQQR